jgi:cobalt-zinc-cadmium efflux system outer membrane protein
MASSTAPRDPDLAGPLDRVTVERLAVARNPGLRAARRRASATRLAGEAEGKLPPPEAEFQIWQVPLARPYDVPGAQMIMLGLRQPIPAPGSLGAKAEAKERDADLELTMADERAREIVRDVDHAFVSYVEATRKHRIHAEHQAVAEAILKTAQARYPAGGALTDITQAEVEVAKIEADVAVEEANVNTARAMLNGLLLRSADAPLGQPVEREATTIGESPTEILARARALRPETRTAKARTAAAVAEARVAEREANGPMMSVGLLYFAPTTQMPSHGYGLSFSSTLPWLWGRASGAVRAQRELARATTDDTADADARIATEVATAEGQVRAQARRLVVLERRSLPAAKRAFQAATSGYTSGGTDILVLLSARNSVVGAEVEIVGAKAALEHALVDLDWAAGAPVRRTPLEKAQ